MLMLAVSFNLLAQKAKKDAGKKNKNLTSPTPKVVHAYLGHSDETGGQISKTMFDSLLKQGVTAKDSLGNVFKVDGFTFSYAERNLYEDSVGKLIILTDFFSEYCPGDTLSRGISLNIYYKTKPGDTAYFDNIKALLPDGRQVGTKAMRFVLTK